MWRKYGTENCFEFSDECKVFAKGRTMMTVVRFKNFVEIENPKPAKALRSILESSQGFKGKYMNLITAKQLIT